MRTWPGATQLTRTVGPYSSAPLLVSAITPALAAEYAASLRVGMRPDTDALLTIVPRPASSMSGTTERVALNVPVRFTSMSRCHSLSSTVCSGRRSPVPALLTSTSIRPNVADDPAHRVLDRVAVADVERVGPAADLVGHGFGARRVAVDDRDGCPLRREAPCGRRADARRAAGDRLPPVRRAPARTEIYDGSRLDTLPSSADTAPRANADTSSSSTRL